MESQSQNAVEMRDVSKIFPSPEGGEVKAVDQVNLQIRQGEFFSLLGPSGCGKTTSLRMIAGFEWPSKGEIIIDGKLMGRTPPFQRPVNTVYQSYALFQHMTVYQNVAFGLEMEKVSNTEIKRRVGEALEMVQMGNLGARKPKQLSGGQQQRVALARALVKRPAVLLLDEPLGALDLKLRKEMQIELKALQVQVGITFIYVTHDQGEALTMSDRIAVMNKGKALQIGNPIEIYERPRKRFVADFIGETNFLTGTVNGINGDYVTVNIRELDIELTGLSQDEMIIGQEVFVSIRPEKIRLAEKQALNLNCLNGRVIQSVYVGSDTNIIIELGKGVNLKVWEQNKISTLDPKAYFYRGQEVWAVLFPENTLVLPVE
jgi:spermidine/putrescine transport system ATP-binding protein